MPYSTEDYVNAVLQGNIRMLSKAITLVESTKAEHRQQAESVLAALMPHSGKSVRVGITGVPGAGKSTFIESFGLMLTAKGHRVAVLAIDPSSSLNKGSILGDKTRMEELAKDPNAFIRPSPSSGFLGGVANTTFETMILCEAAGFDYILIETVGVGQSETLVADISDVFLFLKIIGGGDELQGIKRGIMEMVDVVMINKVDQENLPKAKATRQELLRALHFLKPKVKGWKVPVLLGSALHGEGLDEVHDRLESFINLRKSDGSFLSNRKQQAEKRFSYWVRQYLLQYVQAETGYSELYQKHYERAASLQANPSGEAQQFINALFNR